MPRLRTWPRFRLPQLEILERQRPAPAPRSLDDSIEIYSSNPVEYTGHNSTMKQKKRHRSVLRGIVVVVSFVSFFQYRRFCRRVVRVILSRIVGTLVPSKPTVSALQESPPHTGSQHLSARDEHIHRIPTGPAYWDPSATESQYSHSEKH